MNVKRFLIAGLCWLTLMPTFAFSINYYSYWDLHNHVLQDEPDSTKDDPSKLYLYETFFGNKDFKYGLSTFIKNVPEAHHLAKYKIYTDREMQDELVDMQLSYALNHSMLAGTRGLDHRNQMLLEWAVKEMRRLGLTPGKPLTYSQQRDLRHVIIWPELHTFDGVETVFPKVYVTQAAVDEFKGATSLILAGTINMNIGHLELGFGEVMHGRNGVKINAVYANILGGKVESRDGDVVIHATENITVEEGRVSGKNVDLQGQNINLNNSGLNGINAEHHAFIHSFKNLYSSSPIRSGGDTDIEAGGDAVFYTQHDQHVDHRSAGNTYTKTTTNTQRRTNIQAGGNIRIAAKGKVHGGYHQDDSSKMEEAALDATAGSQADYESAFLAQFGFGQPAKPKPTPSTTASTGNISISGDEGVYLGGASDITDTETTTHKYKNGLLSSSEKKTVSRRVTSEFKGSNLQADGVIKTTSNNGEVVKTGVKEKAHRIETFGAKGVTVKDGKNIEKCSSYSIKKTRGFAGGWGGYILPSNYVYDRDAIGDSRREIWRNCYKETASPSELEATTVVTLRSNQDIEIQSSNVTAQRIEIITPGKLKLTLDTLANNHQKTMAGRNLGYQRSQNKGQTAQTAEYSKITGELDVQASGVEVELKQEDMQQPESRLAPNPDRKLYVTGINYRMESDDNLRDRVSELSSLQGMGWLKTISEHPSVDFQAVELAYHRWNKTNGNLTPEGAVIVAVAVTVATAGSGTAIVNSALSTSTAAASTSATAAGTTAAATGATVAANSAAASALNAGFTAAVNQVTTAAINNEFDLDKTFKELQKDEHLINVIESAATAYLANSMLEQLKDAEGVSEASVAANNGQQMSQTGLQNGIQSGTSVTQQAIDTLETFVNETTSALAHGSAGLFVRSMLNGGDITKEIEKGFVPMLRQAGIKALGATVANEIGQAYKDYINSNGGREALSYLTHKVAHGVVGCQIARLSENSCEAGAFGAVFTEVLLDRPAYDVENFVADIVNDNSELRQKLASADPAVRTAAYNEVVELALAFKAKGVDIAKLGTAISAMLVGFDADEMNMAVTTGTNAAENNAFWFAVIVIYKAVDFAVAVYDSYQLVKEFTSEETTDQRRQEIAQQLMVDGALSASGTRSAKKLFDLIEDKLGIAKEALLNKLNDMLPNNGLQLETANGPSFGGHGSRVDDDPNLYNQNVGGHNASGNGTHKVNTQNAKVKDSPEYEALNNPLPNTRYELDNGTTFKTNSSGYVEEITFTPVDKKMPRDSRQTQAGKEGFPDDVGGHIQACSYGGTCDRFNLFPQNKNFNNSGYKKFENEIRNALKNGDNVGHVLVKFQRKDPSSARPDALQVEYMINGQRFEKRFRNQRGG
jgi:hypothetical protein